MDDLRKKSDGVEYDPETDGGSDTPPEAGMAEFLPDRKEPEPDEKMPGSYGHPRFKEMSEEEVNLHDRKNHDYAAGGNPLGNFYRVSTILGLYPGIDLSNPAVIPLIFAMKQIDAVLWTHSNKHEAEVEGKVDKLKDISIYVKLSRILEEEMHNEEIKALVKNIGLEEEKRNYED